MSDFNVPGSRQKKHDEISEIDRRPIAATTTTYTWLPIPDYLYLVTYTYTWLPIPGYLVTYTWSPIPAYLHQSLQLRKRTILHFMKLEIRNNVCIYIYIYDVAWVEPVHEVNSTLSLLLVISLEHYYSILSICLYTISILLLSSLSLSLLLLLRSLRCGASSRRASASARSPASRG